VPAVTQRATTFLKQDSRSLPTRQTAGCTSIAATGGLVRRRRWTTIQTRCLVGTRGLRQRTQRSATLDRNRGVAIPAQYDAAYPFANCRAKVCVGCSPDRWSYIETEAVKCGGDVFMIDESGNRLESVVEDSGECATKPDPDAAQ